MILSWCVGRVNRGTGFWVVLGLMWQFLSTCREFLAIFQEACVVIQESAFQHGDFYASNESLETCLDFFE